MKHKQLSYTELKQLNLPGRAEVYVCMENYKYKTTYKWATTVYTKIFCESHNIWFEIR